jgi:hypothetical protein
LEITSVFSIEIEDIEVPEFEPVGGVESLLRNLRDSRNKMGKSYVNEGFGTPFRPSNTHEC